tara:strand:- start:1245 stop:1388 length:144 start_codon:yes stop_codon:yes gene_type:complete
MLRAAKYRMKEYFQKVYQVISLIFNNKFEGKAFFFNKKIFSFFSKIN